MMFRDGLPLSVFVATPQDNSVIPLSTKLPRIRWARQCRGSETASMVHQLFRADKKYDLTPVRSLVTALVLLVQQQMPLLSMIAQSPLDAAISPIVERQMMRRSPRRITAATI